MTSTSPHHAIDYVEIPAPDLAAAQRFYGDAFGWEFTAYGDAYVGIRTAGVDREIGGFDPTGTPSGSGPLVQLWSDDLDASRDAVVAAGGTLTRDVFAFPDGRRFQFLDPAGNQLGAWSAT